MKMREISRDIDKKLYDKNKLKTSNAVKFPRHLIIGFEKGWNMLANVMGIPVNSWREALDIKKQ